jgi:hypothetical protein
MTLQKFDWKFTKAKNSKNTSLRALLFYEKIEEKKLDIFFFLKQVCQSLK